MQTWITHQFFPMAYIEMPLLKFDVQKINMGCAHTLTDKPNRCKK